jgi:hypothetical protein
MTQRQHMTYRILCTVSENGNVLLILPFSNLMFHIVWHSMTVFPKSTLRCIPGQIRQNKNVQKLRNQIVNDQEAKRQELVMARERLLANKRRLQATISSPTSDSNVAIDRIRAEKLKLITCPDIPWIQYWSLHTLHVNPNYYDRGSANKVASIINEYRGGVRN